MMNKIKNTSRDSKLETKIKKKRKEKTNNKILKRIPWKLSQLSFARTKKTHRFEDLFS